MSYAAIYPKDTIEAHRAFLARRRALRPPEEYRSVTLEEWDEFLDTSSAANSPSASADAPTEPTASTNMRTIRPGMTFLIPLWPISVWLVGHGLPSLHQFAPDR